MNKNLLFFLFLIISTLGNTPVFAVTRTYFIAAEDGVWDFAPSGKNLVHCHSDPAPCAIPSPWTDSHRFPVTRYIQYRDASFKDIVQQPPWLGILGPIIRAEVGDKLSIHFCNHTHGKQAYSMHPHGLRYTRDDEGAHYYGVNSGSAPGKGSAVLPGQCFDYAWEVLPDSGPGPGDASSKVWWYHSHIDEPANLNTGLLGPVIITRQGSAKADGSPSDVDQEFITAFFIFDKLKGEEAGLMHSINGYIFGNLKGLVIHKNQKVRWYVMGLGNEEDLHTPHWHGQTLLIGNQTTGQRVDVASLLPATTLTADMLADHPGEWLLHCHVSDHIYAGMSTTYQVLP